MNDTLPELREIGSFHVGGGIYRLDGLPLTTLKPMLGSPALEVDGNGLFPGGQMYVQCMRLKTPRIRLPLMLWHGGGLTGACWETTPDGRPGWQTAFLRRGYDVFVSDAVERGRAGWARSPEIFPGKPFFMPQHAAWSLYRVGPPDGFSADSALRTGFAGTLFPVESYDAFCRQIVPRFQGNEALIEAAYDAYLDRCGPAIVVAHSQGGGFAVSAAARRPDKVAALVLVEPGGVPQLDAADVEALGRVPLLTVWGDNIAAVEFWVKARTAIDRLISERREGSATTCVIDLPSEGIHGNSHLPMMDRNSDFVADRIADWLDAQFLD